MIRDKIKTTRPAVPKIYGYTTPEIERHEGWTKIGYTEQDVDERIKQQTHTADVIAKKEWEGLAYYEDGSGSFRDTDFHAYLRKLGIEQDDDKNNEWFHVTGPVSKGHFFDFRENKGIIAAIKTAIGYNLRDEQEEAVSKTLDYRKTHEKGEFLWNAKPRFGKTLSVYDFCKRVKAKNVLIVTNRPAIANSWYSDYVNFMGEESGFKFVSSTEALKGFPYVISRREYIESAVTKGLGCIEFISLQDLKGSINFGGKFDKNKEIADIMWDVLVIDEAHEGVDTYKTDVAFNHINRAFTIHLSGTPFKALANDKFPEEAIYNWTYADEQEAKKNWDTSNGEENPYGTLPRLNLFTYQMSEIIKDEIKQGIEIQGETEEYAFDLNEFFATNGSGRFIHDSAVDRFLDAMATQEKFPFSTVELRNELKHTMWLLNRVDSAKALAKKLEEHEVFKEYKIVLAAGDGKINDSEENQKSYDKVIDAIHNNDKTITISVGQLTTGVTIPEWTAVMMLSNIKSPALYMQAAFRAQNPCLFDMGGKFARKENAYVFDFDPARTLIIFEQFANDLSPNTVKGSGDVETRKENIKRLLNFFPVLGEDEDGKMIELDAEKVLSIPRKIKSQEVVRRGFMSNYLFQNISGIFGAPQEVIDIINQFEPVAEPKNKIKDAIKTMEDIPIDENGEVAITDEYAIGQESEVFGEKIYGFEDIPVDVIETAKQNTTSAADKLKEAIKTSAIKEIVETVKVEYADDIKKSDSNQIERQLVQKSNDIVNKAFGEYEIKKNVIEKERKEELEKGGDEDKINNKYNELQEEAANTLSSLLMEEINSFVKEAKKDSIKTVETNIKEREKDSVENTVRDHLRGFSRTIPSFLMAYGDDTVTLATFDSVVPDQVFVEVTSITLEQFKFLRDGGKYTDKETGEEKVFKGKLFDEVVFDDSVKEFLRLKKKLADYFDEKSIEDIFDYIPPQKTNQIFTPKDVVKRMVDMLEKENPGCFDMPDKTFIDLYMKSGLYITEIVKRLYQSEELKKLFPDKTDRLRHIFENQVYGLAPTEIIYKIATNYILGFDTDVKIEKHNFKQVDALPYVKEGTLKEKLEELYGKEID